MTLHLPQTLYMVHRGEVGLSLLVTRDSAVVFHHLGDDETSLLASLSSSFPSSSPTPMPANLRSHYSRWLDDLIQNGTTDEAIALALQGTPFQQRVWRHLMTIPRGDKRSYSDVARAIGSPSAVRAVASACAQNDIALAIPCHRIVRADGSLGGYRWGIERKKVLLSRESQA